MSKLVSRIAPMSWGVSDSGDDQREGADMGVGVPAAGDPPAVGILGPVDDLLEQLDLVASQAVRPALGDPGDAGGQAGDAQHIGRAPFEKIGKCGRLGRARRIAAGAPFAPGPKLCRRCAGRRRARRCRSGRRAPCGRGTPASRSAWRGGRSARHRPTGPRRPGTGRRPRARSRAIASIGCTVPSTFEACVIATSDVLGVIACLIASGST